MGSPDFTRAGVLLCAVAALACGNVSTPPVDGGGGDVGSSGAGGGVGAGGAQGTGGGNGRGGGIGSDCRSQADCGGAGISCLAPGESPGCGTCRQPTAPCTVDADCASRGAAWICELPACSCSDAKSCVAGCIDAGGCATGQFCSADHRCVANVCTPGDRSCLPNFVCGSDGHCARKTCDKDADCPGACVQGLCYPRPGTCTPPAA